jgi:hypothetical protein
MGKFAGLQTIKESAPREPAVAELKPSPAAAATRKLGKRQDPDYQQISVYMNSGIYLAAKRKLLGSGEDFSGWSTA